MDITRLKYFATVARTGSIRAAADLLRLSPAALSKAIKLLEHEVGVALLRASGRGIVLTEQGRELSRRAEPLLSGLERLTTDLRASRSTETPLRFGSFEVFTTYLLGELVSRHLDDRPLVVHELVPGNLERALERNEVDLGLTYIPIPSQGLDYLRVCEIEMGVFGREGAFAGVPFGEVPFVIPVHPIEGSPNRVRGLDGWPEDEIERSVRYRVTMMESALELCRRGVAVAYLPRFVVALHNASVRAELRLYPLASPVTARQGKHSVYLVKRKSDGETEITKKLAKAVRLICGRRTAIRDEFTPSLTTL